jgi:hydroxymethylpyrimidine pyrophosphatase-like HAD family hydrolase
MVVTDLDGTLLGPDRQASPRNLRTLEELGRRGRLRVIATGRNLFSARKVLAPDFPVDYLLFSSGAGIMDWPAQRLLRAVNLSGEQAGRAFRVFAGRRLDFMVHRPIPDNHYFRYYASGRNNPDFEARLRLYAPFASAGDPRELPGEACQLLAVEPAELYPSAYEELAAELAGLTVLRATSPLDGRSRWIEVFSPLASKSRAAAWLAQVRGVDPRRVLAVGNDYNDLDLLQWAASSCLVSGAPPELKARFPVIGSADDSDFAQAVEAWEQGRLPKASGTGP